MMKDKFECRGGYGSLDEMCSKVKGAHIRESHGVRWCGCDGEHHHHIEHNGHENGKETWVCMRTDIHSPKDCDNKREVPIRWKKEDHGHEEWRCIPRNTAAGHSW